MKQPILLAVAIVAMLLTISPRAMAVEYGGVGGVPANPQADNPRTKSIFVYALKPGQQKNDGVRVYNNTSEQRTVSVYAVDSVIASGGAFSCAQRADPKLSAGNWIKLASSQVSLAPGTNQVVPFTITIPKDAATGEHNGCIAIEDGSMTQPTGEKSGVVLGFRSAIRVAVTVPGAIVKELNIEKVGISHLKDGSYVATTLARNNGNVSLDASIQVKLSSFLGNSVASTKATYPVLAHSTARWDSNFKTPAWGGWYRATTVATYNSNPAAGLGNNNGTQKSVRASSTYFFVAPRGIPAIIELALLVLIIGFMAWLIRRNHLRRHVKRKWQVYTMEEGDTLHGLAKTHAVAWKQIAKVNKLKPPYHLERGQKLRLPPKAGD